LKAVFTLTPLAFVLRNKQCTVTVNRSARDADTIAPWALAKRTQWHVDVENVDICRPRVP
jgi:hypothetical protein